MTLSLSQTFFDNLGAISYLVHVVDRLFVDAYGTSGTTNPKSKNHCLDINSPQFQSIYQPLMFILLLCQLFEVSGVRSVASFYQPYFSTLRLG